MKIHWVLLIKQQSQHWPNRGGSQAIKIKEFNVRSKYYKTGLILTFGLSDGFLGKPFCENPLGFDCKTPIATLARSDGVRKRSKRPKMEEYKVRGKYYKTSLILTCRPSEGSLGKPFCENPLGFDDKTAIATLARSEGVRKRSKRPK